MMPGLGQVARILVEVLPEKWPYVNLFPTYATTAQLGAPDYETYLRRFVESVLQPAISPFTGEEAGEMPVGWLAPGGGILLHVE